MMVSFPDRFSFRREVPLLRRFHAELAADGIPMVDMAAHFRSLDLRLKEVDIDGHGHLSPIGHAIAGEKLQAAMLAVASGPSRR